DGGRRPGAARRHPRRDDDPAHRSGAAARSVLGRRGGLPRSLTCGGTDAPRGPTGEGRAALGTVSHSTSMHSEPSIQLTPLQVQCLYWPSSQAAKPCIPSQMLLACSASAQTAAPSAHITGAIPHHGSSPPKLPSDPLASWM